MTGEYRAREAFGEEKDLWWGRAVHAYPAYADYQLRTDRKIPVFALEPLRTGAPYGERTGP